MNHDSFAACARRFLAPTVLAGLTVLGTLGVASTASASPTYDPASGIVGGAEPASTPRTTSASTAKAALPSVSRAGGTASLGSGRVGGSMSRSRESHGALRTGGFGGVVHSAALPAHGGYGGHSARAYRTTH